MTIREALAASSRSAADGMLEGYYPVHVHRQKDGTYEVVIYRPEEKAFETVDVLEALTCASSTSYGVTGEGQPLTVIWSADEWTPE